MRAVILKNERDSVLTWAEVIYAARSISRVETPDTFAFLVKCTQYFGLITLIHVPLHLPSIILSFRILDFKLSTG